MLSARLSDAKFFWENDLRLVKAGGLQGMGAGLANVTFHNKLGSQADRVARIAALAFEIAPLVKADPAEAKLAAEVAKADLQSAMVGEFPELQGLMGMYYARAAGLPDAVARAARDHYSPLGPSDAVPSDPVSVAVALADKIDTLTGFWAIDEKPTGSKDPFALRRAALGVIRLVVGNGKKLPLKQTFAEFSAFLESDPRIEYADIYNDIIEFGQHSGDGLLGGASFKKYVRLHEQLASDLLTFLHDRLKIYLRDQGIRHDVIDACLAMPNNDDLTLLVKRAEALAAFLKTDDGPNLLAGYKRASTILAQAEAKDGVEYSYGADIRFADCDEERALFKALDVAESKITPAMKAEDFAAAMAAMASLRAPIDGFFTAVQVNADSEILRRNRLNLLHRIRNLCGQVADLTKLDG